MSRLQKTLTAALLLFLPAFSYAEPSVSHDEPTSQEIKIVKGKDKGKIKIPREMFPDVKAYFNGDTVYVDLYETVDDSRYKGLDNTNYKWRLRTIIYDKPF